VNLGVINDEARQCLNETVLRRPVHRRLEIAAIKKCVLRLPHYRIVARLFEQALKLRVVD